MKLHNKIYRSLTSEPFETQKIGERDVELYYLNDTPHLAQFVQKGRFYVWTSDGNNYRLVVEKGYYEKVGYFFTEEINAIWINFLDEVGVISKKMSRLYLFGSLAAAVVIIGVSFAVPGELGETLRKYGIFVALTVVLIANMVHSSKLNKVIKEKNYATQLDIRNVLTEQGFEKLIKDQEEYYQEYFKFDEEDELEEVVEEIETAVLLDAVAEEIVEEAVAEEVLDEIIEEAIVEEIIEEAVEEAIVEELVEEVVEEAIIEAVVEEAKKAEPKKPVKKNKSNKVDYNTLTVPQLRKLAKELELTGYSTMRKAELVDLITNKR